MVHIIFDPNSITLEQYIQIGSGMSYFHGVPYYKGRGYSLRKGSGVGGVLRGLWRFFYPLLKKEGVETGRRILQDIAQGPINAESVKETVVSQGMEGLKNMVEGAREKFRQQKQQGSGKRRHRKRPIIITNSDILEHTSPKRSLIKKRQDNLGFY